MQGSRGGVRGRWEPDHRRPGKEHGLHTKAGGSHWGDSVVEECDLTKQQIPVIFK